VSQNYLERSNNSCELCKSQTDINIVHLEPETKLFDNGLVLCKKCSELAFQEDVQDAQHWRCLNESIWSEYDAVKVLAWRLLTKLNEDWSSELIDMMYFDDDLQKWAEAGIETSNSDEKVIHLDSNGAILENGDTVTLIKELDVKGANFSAKRGTAVRNIRLVHDNPEQIEGKIEGQSIVILTKFVKK
jgi:protein PhnA